MLTDQTNTVYNCARCGEPKARHHRTGEWVHIRHDSLCHNDGDPVPVLIRIPARLSTDVRTSVPSVLTH